MEFFINDATLECSSCGEVNKNPKNAIICEECASSSAESTEAPAENRE
jgi:Zn finger protein HypA/HybF involved in hydrogenase expression